MATATEPEKSKQAAYILPKSLIQRIKFEAARLGVWPAEVVRIRLERSFIESPDGPD